MRWRWHWEYMSQPCSIFPEFAVMTSSFQMRWKIIQLQYCFLLVPCVFTALEAVPIDIDKTKVHNTEPVESAKIEPPVSAWVDQNN